MKYKVYVYKATLESLTATQLLDQDLKYENPVPRSYTTPTDKFCGRAL